jgi:hypothetical protein
MIDAVEGSRSKYQFASKDSQLNQDCDCVSDDLADFVSHCTLLSIVENRMQHLNSGTRAGCVSTAFHSAHAMEIGENFRRSAATQRFEANNAILCVGQRA